MQLLMVTWKLLAMVSGKMFKYSLIVLLSSINAVYGQYSPVLDNYVQTGLKSNLTLQRKQQHYEKSLHALNASKGLFYPSLSLNARYSVADGGRVIDFPVGDLLNPVYSTLNNLIEQPSFPSIENEQINFIRSKEHETKLRLTQPLYNPKIKHNHDIKNELTAIQKANEESYKRQLVAEIKTAYFDYLKTIEAETLINKNLILLEENIRVNERLYANNKVTVDQVYRSKSEYSKVQQKLKENERDRNVAAAYFNFLLNQPLTLPIEIDSVFVLNNMKLTIDSMLIYATNEREEMNMLRTAVEVADKSVKINKSEVLPKLTAVVDYGFQGEKYRFSGDDDFVIASLVLSWDIFKGQHNRAKIQEALIEKNISQKQLEETEKKIQLEVIHAYYDFIASREAIHSAQMQVKTAEKAFDIIHKKYNLGQSNLLEFTDARTSMVNARQNLVLTKYDMYMKYVKLEKAAALYNFNQ